LWIKISSKAAWCLRASSKSENDIRPFIRAFHAAWSGPCLVRIGSDLSSFAVVSMATCLSFGRLAATPGSIACCREGVHEAESKNLQNPPK
jgi:hypothetical protein